MKSAIGMRNLVFFSSGYNISTLFLNLQRMYLAQRDRDSLQTRFPLRSTIRRIMTWQSLFQRAAISVTRGAQTDRDTIQTRYSLRSIVRCITYNLTTPIREVFPISDTRGSTGQLCLLKSWKPSPVPNKMKNILSVTDT